MYIHTLQPSGLRLLRTAICVAGLAALSVTANAAEQSNTPSRCEPITKACNNPLIVPRQTATARAETAATPPTKRSRCEPITKVCIYQSDARSDSPAPALEEKKEPSATSKRNRCEPITKVCIYR